MKFVFVGPQQTGSQTFHVHAEGCRDIQLSLRTAGGSKITSDNNWPGYIVDADSAREAVAGEIEAYNADGMGYAPEHFRVFDCAKRADGSL